MKKRKDSNCIVGPTLEFPEQQRENGQYINYYSKDFVFKIFDYQRRS